MRQSTLLFWIAIAAATWALPAHAQHSHDHKPRYGGLVKEANNLVFELVATPALLTVHVTDEQNKPVATNGSTATLTLIDSGSRVEVPLQSGEGNTLVAKGMFPVRKGVSAMLKVFIGDKEIALVRYTLR